MFEKLIDINEEDFIKYKSLKGTYLYKHVYDILLDFNGGNCVSYKELSSIIRCDKNLRDKLYIYLATFEESLKADILDHFDVKSETEMMEKYTYSQFLEEVKVKESFKESKLYFLLKFDLGKLIDFCDKKNFHSEIKDKLKIVKDLRNKVMHHNLLILGNCKNKETVLQNINLLENQILTLKELLSKDYRQGFISDINRINYDQNSKAKFLERCWLGVL